MNVSLAGAPRRRIGSKPLRAAVWLALFLSAGPGYPAEPRLPASAFPPPPPARGPVEKSPADPGRLPSAWWTIEQAGRALVLMGCTLLGATLWVLTLKRQLREKTREMREELQREAVIQERYRQLFETANDMVFTLDPAGRITSFNAAAQRITGFDLAGAIGRDFVQLLASGENPDKARKMLLTAASTPSEAPYELSLRSKSGRKITLEIDSRPLLQNGAKAGFQAIARDVTERRHLEDQLRQSQKMESIGRLAGGIAHDFNNILTIIQGHANLQLASPGLDPDVSDSAEQIQKASERAANLTRQLLAFSRKQVIQLGEVDLNAVVEEMTKMLQRILGEDIALQFDYCAGLPKIEADEGMLEQILLNLAVNSRDAMPKGGRLSIQTAVLDITPESDQWEPEATVGPTVALRVTDTGCGIEPSHLPRVFEPFFTTKDVGKGTGLGLATVYGIVKQHRGWIRVSSVVHQGTTFEILFPALLGPAQPLVPPPVLAPARGAETILVVEDEAPLRALMRRVLQKHGYTVLEAEHAPAAMEVWRQNRARIDLVITDLVMPEGVNGMELSIRLRLENPSLKVIYSSGYSPETAGQDLTLTDGMYFLQKPYGSETLAKRVRDCLDERVPVEN